MKSANSLKLGLLVLCACGGGSGSTLTGDEQDVADRTGRGSNATQALATVSDSLFSFDPTLDPTKTDVQNAQAIQAQATVSLNGCGSATLSGTTVTVDFGAGCTLKNGAVVSGSASLGVTKAGSTLTVAATFTQLHVNSQLLDGSLSFVTANATTFTTTGTLTTSDGSFTVNLTFTGTSTSITTDGTLSETMGAAKSNFTFTSVVWKRADCYPSAGTAKVARGLITTVITFDANTPSTGKVTVTVGKKTSTSTLPAYGSCP